MWTELKSKVDVAQAIVPLLRTTTVTGSAVDLQGYGSAMVVFEAGAITDGTFTPKLTECDTSGGSYTDVAAADYVGGAAPAALSQNTVARYGYIGSKEFVKAVITVTGSPSTGGTVGAVVVRGHASQNPLA